MTQSNIFNGKQKLKKLVKTACIDVAFKNLLGKLALNTANILLENLSVSYLLLHLSCLPRVSSKHEQAWCEPVQAVDCPQVLQVVFLGQDEDHGVMTVATTRVNLITSNLSDLSPTTTILYIASSASPCLCRIVGMAMLVLWANRRQQLHSLG